MADAEHISMIETKETSRVGCCCGGGNKQMLHLYYRLEWLQQEIEKRSSYLGKFRKTEEQQHLLDLLAMTKDEQDLFYPFVKAASADVFDALQQYTGGVDNAYKFNEGNKTKILTAVPQVLFDTHPFYESTDPIGNEELNIEYSLQQPIDFNKYEVKVSLEIQYTIEYTIKATSQKVQEQRSMIIETTNFDNTYCSFDLVIPLALETTEFSEERFVSLDSFKQGEQVDFRTLTITDKQPDTFKKGDYVLLNNELYIAQADGDVNDISVLQKQEYDFRESVHYLLEYPDYLNENMIEPIDTAVFEALVNRVIFKWLMLAFPDEAENYLALYNEALQQVKSRFVRSNPIVKRTPRII